MCSESDLKDLGLPMGPRKKLQGLLKEEQSKKVMKYSVTLSPMTGRGSSAGSVSALYIFKRPRNQHLRLVHILSWKKFLYSANSRRASCQLLWKEWTLNTDKLPSGVLPRSSVVN